MQFFSRQFRELIVKLFFNRTPPMDRAPLKKIKNILSTFSFPRFTVHNPTSNDVFYVACLLYRAMYGLRRWELEWSTKEGTERFFRRAL